MQRRIIIGVVAIVAIVLVAGAVGAFAFTETASPSANLLPAIATSLPSTAPAENPLPVVVVPSASATASATRPAKAPAKPPEGQAAVAEEPAQLAGASSGSSGSRPTGSGSTGSSHETVQPPTRDEQSDSNSERHREVGAPTTEPER